MSWHENLEKESPAFAFASSPASVVRSVAGPGSGKSFAIGRRIARLIEEGADPKRILAITFTRTAARDLRQDISALSVVGSEDVAAHTVHSHALGILMRENVVEQTGRIPRMILDHEISPALRDIISPQFGNVDNKKALLNAYLAGWATLQADAAGFVKDKIEQAFENEIVAWMRAHGGMHVGEVIPVAIRYLRDNPASDAIGKYDTILVDEYQDLNKSEQEFIRLIRGTANLVIVGDDDQSIYGFKFAHPDGIKTIDQLHGEFDDVPFDQCRRCPTDVTTLASNLISKNPNRTLGDLVPFSENADGIIQIVQWLTADDEVTGIPEIIQKELASKVIQPQDVLVLTPRRVIGYAFRDQLVELGIPARSYFRESSIKKLGAQQAYSRIVLAGFPEDTISLRFLVGANASNFRSPQYAKVCEYATAEGKGVAEVLRMLDEEELKLKHVSTISSAYHAEMIAVAAVRTQMKAAASELFENTFSKDGNIPDDLRELADIYATTLEKYGSYDSEGGASFDDWLKGLISNFQTDVANPELPTEIDHVRVMSLHSSKGLSAKFVLVCSQIDELIPGKEQSDAHLQEQRRLFYVAVTRCKAAVDFPGRLIVSSFRSLSGQDALTMGIPARVDQQRKVRATRYVADFGPTAPAAVLGSTLLK